MTVQNQLNETNNIDLICAELGKKIVNQRDNIKKSDVENHIQKALGVLQEDGIYAFYAYLNSVGNFSDTIAQKSWEIFHKLGHIEENYDKKKFSEQLSKDVLNDLDETFLAKQVLERTLIYARYHAKALPEEKED